MLGCGVGFGLLHRIPKPQDRLAAPAELSERPQTPPPRRQATHSHTTEVEDDDEDEDDLNSGVSLVDTSFGNPARPAFQPRPQQQQQAPSFVQSSKGVPAPLNLGRLPVQQITSRMVIGPPLSPSSAGRAGRSSVAEVVPEEDEE